ncbi:FixH family protein [Psychromonas sp.]|uniref:FixH family protein n=1 Tax=Psychromonas sp. TaxID=1884585 RepID=UPI00356501B3
MKNSNNKAWFKQFWPWFLIILPLCAVVGGISTVIIATDNKPDMVVDDYYSKGKAINKDLTLIKNARAKNISAAITQSGSELIINLTGVRDNSSIYLFLFHSTLSERDLSQLLTADGNGNYRYRTELPLQGKWQIRIEPFDKSWRLQKTVTLPAASFTLQ